ncbi:VOC family protein [Hymenobacter chitinivorans]|uniref:Putative 3-demethylubiquinone-9 3-methyltransferase (Glyoxalase superfamily) n=1 Tax=Hymenobacter chitinivorans DSM 11115 TaxID=1121954 RepID=A0A2M9BL94_9BACT|nr:VOC family protein [Hymenobacter chitinivorans]PJJ58726.1 putative 3-demethylubiquinone-9 3-methyltransferase (glyoxalase superfamily) [Hymenobacter chitinivorans DSM 11115]
MQKITTFLTFNNQAEEAAQLYTSLFPDSAIQSITRYSEGTYMPAGSVMTVEFELAGQKYVALNGGPYFTFTTGISLSVSCQNQAEIDALWDKLTADGGEPGDCGWLKDRFGVSWQITPANIGQLLRSDDPARAQRKMAAMMQMHKLDIATLEQA